jgi:hypothetical protein
LCSVLRVEDVGIKISAPVKSVQASTQVFWDQRFHTEAAPITVAKTASSVITDARDSLNWVSTPAVSMAATAIRMPRKKREPARSRFQGLDYENQVGGLLQDKEKSRVHSKISGVEGTCEVDSLEGFGHLELWGVLSVEPAKGFRVQVPGFRVQGSGFGVQGSGFRFQGSGFRVQGSGFRVQGSGCKV